MKKTSSTKQSKVASVRILLLAAFLEGSMIITVELLGAKMLIPLYGNSLVVWTSVLGITITFLALGYLVGGILSLKKDLLKKASFAFAISAFLILFMPVLAEWLFDWLLGVSVYTGAVVAAVLLLGAPLLALSVTSPFLIQQLVSLQKNSAPNNQAGEAAGLIYAISTIGGILFTFFIGFLALPHWGISFPVLLCSLVLFGMACYLYYDRKYLAIGIGMLVLVLKIFAGQSNDRASNSKIIYSSEGLLGQLKVVDIFDARSQFPFRYLFINGVPQTVITNDDSPTKGSSGWPYSHKIAMLSSLKQKQQRVLLLGIGGGSVARELTSKKISTDMVDLDERMYGIARKYFYLEDQNSEFTSDDGRHYVRTCKKQYDMIVMDVFNAEVQPSYMFTRESFADLKRILKNDGIMVFNFGELSKHEGISAYRSVCNTLLSEGLKVYCNFREEENINDVLIMSSPVEIDFNLLKKDSFNTCCISQPWAADFAKDPAIKIDHPFEDGVILTDDKPMLEVLNAETIKMWREWAIANYAVPDIKANRRLFK